MPSDYVFNRILVTNDDGYGAPGLMILKEIAQSLAREVWVVAPFRDQSGVSHSISIHDPLRLIQKDEKDYAVTGTPADCVIMGAKHLMKTHPPDLILSGINSGANLGTETLFSGTVGAAMTGMLLDIPSIALSQAYADPDNIPWATSRKYGAQIIREILKLKLEHKVCFNVNFPNCGNENVKNRKFTTQGKGLLNGADVQAETDPRNKDYFWLQLRHKDDKKDDNISSEAYNLSQNYITISPLQFERTHHDTLEQIEQQLG
ncbi:5'/3'-nucleotidase SurE [Aristophania vespae]|uniref:5'-nucleotidase SurE n=1 Tax=Aristophania vespae TaxID=2697033 RepID=A0A6P1NDB8_9PROT|nr:5'/3'-nucleotidase SurE [Aristophania vespae]QHI95508.1 5'/3'-nucleotidase SurE [Aristophania vespae]